ncbi:gfo/Idh/MocA family oxidoreductase [bacterium 1xD42-62]|uniref:Gfo/Idh/MocA family oxidoreductase n=2 Tax=Parablautia muri TaxID=2320879 RepID=A0A9X5BJW1_9FIRM|nr:gfo/Idh/MocA family oxidoreductase [Parablautia muri]
MKVGVIGCGGMGTTHYLSLKALSSQMDIEVAALADCRKEYLDKAVSYFPGAKTYHYGMELIEKETLDIVHICLPTYMHAEHVVAAMEKGMHVFVEKPVCLTPEEGRQILDAQKRTKGRAMVGQVVRLFGEYRYLKQVYDKQAYGRLKSMVMQRISGDVQWGFEDWFHDEKKSGSVVLDLHIHDLDFLRYMLGEPDYYDVRATAFESGMINQVIATYQFKDAFVTAEGLWNVSPALEFQAGFRACFEEATVIYDGTKSPSLCVYKKDGTVEVPELSMEFEMEDDTAGINVSNLGPYYTEIQYFLQCIMDGKPIEVAPLAEGVKSAELALKVWEAAKDYVKKHEGNI